MNESSTAEVRYLETVTLVDQVKSAMTEDGLNQASTAKRIGITAGVLNQWLQSKYSGDNHKVEEAVKRWLDSRQEKLSLPQLPEVGFVETHTSKRIRAVLAASQYGTNIGIVYGASGAGKTYTIKYYAKTNSNVWVVTASPATNTVNSLLDEICDTLGINLNGLSNKLQMQRAIVRFVKNTGGLLIIDEAQHLTKAALEAARTIHDIAGIGMVFVGNETVYSNFTGGGRRAAEFAQLFGRIGANMHIIKPSLRDITALLAAWSITGESIKLLKAIGQKAGGLRIMVQTIKQAYLFCEETPTAEDVREAWGVFSGEVVGGDD